MKKYLVPVLMITVLAPTERAFSLFGVGVYGLSDPITVAPWSDSRFGGIVSLNADGFDNALGLGGFLYIDALPFIDLEVSIEAAGKNYDFRFENDLATLPKQQFGWVRGSAYVTVRRKLIGFGVPVLGGVRLNAGGGLNFHSSTPLATIDTMEELLGGDLKADFDAGSMKEELKNYLKENKIDGSGFHVQAGLQLKVLALNAFVTYRLTMAEDVVPHEKSFSSLWAGLAFGF